MAGAGLVQIKRRIKSISNTRKITRAMGLVATSKLRKVKEVLKTNEEYYKSVIETKDLVLSKLPEETLSIFFQGDEDKDTLYIILTSDAGLSGGFNISVINYFRDNIAAKGYSPQIIVVGEKGIGYINKLGYQTVAEYVDLPDIPTMKEVRTISQHAMDLYKSGAVGEVKIVYTKFLNSVKYTVTEETLLPITMENEEIEEDYIVEPKVEDIVEDVLNLNLRAKILNCLINSKASEQSARMSAMDGATKNADDLLSELKTKFNRIRQSIITQEISEIVGGAEAQK